MASKRIDNFYRGDTKKYKFTFTGLDITGWELWFTLKNSETDDDTDSVLQIKATAGTDPNDDPVNGIMYLTLTSSDTDILDPLEYHYDFQRVIPVPTPADVRTLLKGKVKVLVDISRKTT